MTEEPIFPGVGAASVEQARAEPDFPALIGPVKCPSCGWDDDGTLRVVDWYDEASPPGRRPTHTLAVWGDDEERDGWFGLLACPVCDEDFSDPATMARREP